MLWDFDGRANRKATAEEALEENYARELLKLHAPTPSGSGTTSGLRLITQAQTFRHSTLVVRGKATGDRKIDRSRLGSFRAAKDPVGDLRKPMNGGNLARRFASTAGVGQDISRRFASTADVRVGIGRKIAPAAGVRVVSAGGSRRQRSLVASCRTFVRGSSSYQTEVIPS